MAKRVPKPKKREQKFWEWAQAEGLLQAVKSRMEEIESEHKLNHAESVESLIREFGWRELTAEEEAAVPVVMGYEEAVAHLPTQTPKGISVFSWIASHPKMPGSHEKKGDRIVVITGDDVLKAPCGRAPSKEAANALRQYVNAPDLFWKAWAAVQSRLEAKIIAAAEEEDEDPGIVDVEKMLLEMKTRNRLPCDEEPPV